ncbi:MAG: hypothetical protein RL559_1511 [Pseudomonadota bacterium]
MSAYLVVDTDLTDPEHYEQYKLRAKPIVEAHGGQYLARGGAMDFKETELWKPKRMVLIRFDSVEQAQRFYNSAEYQAVLPISQRAAKRTVVILEGV